MTARIGGSAGNGVVRDGAGQAGRARARLAGGVSALALSAVGIAVSMQAALAAPCATASSGSNTVAATCTGELTWSAGALSVNSGVTIASTGAGIYIAPGGSVGQLTNNGHVVTTATLAAAFVNNGTATTLTNNGTFIALRRALDNEGTIGTILNAHGGTVSVSSDRGQAIVNNGVAADVINAGLITISGTDINYDGAPNGTINTPEAANDVGITNYQTVTGAIINSGTIAVSNTHTLTTTINATAYTIAAGSATGIMNTGSGIISAIVNTGLITVSGPLSSGINNNTSGSTNLGTVGVISNSGIILSSGYHAKGIVNWGDAGTVVNSGTVAVSGTGARGIYNGSGSIGTVINSGLVSATGDGSFAIRNLATLSEFDNSGTVKASGAGALAFLSTSVIAQLTNTGVIDGSVSITGGAQTFTGGSGTVFGTWTGGTMTDTSGVVFTGNNALGDAVNGDVSNSGTLKLISTVAVTGSYTGTGTFGVVGSGSDIGNLQATGTAALDPNLLVSFSPNAAYQTTYTIVTASSVTGTFSSVTEVNAPTGFTYDVNYLADEVKLTLEPTATGPAQSYASATAGISNGTTSFSQVLFDRLSGSEGNDAGGVAGLMPVNTGAAAGDAPADNGAWARPFVRWASVDGSGSTPGWSSTSGGVAGGVDHTFDTGQRVGFALGYMHDSINPGSTATSGSASAHADSYGLALYGRQPFHGLLLDGDFSYVYDQLTVSRDTSTGTATSSPDGQEVGLSLRGSYPITVADAWSVAPLAGLAYVYHWQDAVTESGAGSNDLTVASVSHSSLRGNAGARLEGHYDLVNGAQLSPYLEAGAQYEFLTPTTSVSAALATSPTLVYTSPTVAPDRLAASVAVGADLKVRDKLHVYGDLSGQYGGNWNNQTASLGVRLSF